MRKELNNVYEIQKKKRVAKSKLLSLNTLKNANNLKFNSCNYLKKREKNKWIPQESRKIWKINRNKIRQNRTLKIINDIKREQIIKDYHKNILVAISFYSVFKVWILMKYLNRGELCNLVYEASKNLVSKSNKDNPK